MDRAFHRRSQSYPRPVVALISLCKDLLQGRWGAVFTALLLGLIGVASTLVQPTIIGRLVDGFQSPSENGTYIPVIAVLFVLSAVTATLQGWILERVGQQTVFDVRTSVLRKLDQLPFLYLHRLTRGQLVSRIISDTYMLRDVVAKGLVEAILGLVTVIAAFILMGRIDLVLLLVVFGALMIVIVAISFVAAATRPAAAAMQEQVGDLTSKVSVSLDATKTLRAGNNERYVTERSVRAAEKARDIGLRLAFLRAIVQTVSNVSVQLVIIAVIAIGASRTAAGVLTLGELSSFILYAAFAVVPAANFAGILASLNEAAGAYDRVTEVLDEPSEDRDGAVEKVPSNHENEFEFQNVDFSYPGGAPVLQDATFSIPRNKTTALVGLSGEGKSTIFSLIAQLVDPGAGCILFRGRNTAELSRKTVRAALGLVDQTPPLVGETVLSNLAIGNENLVRDEAQAVLTALGLNEDSVPNKQLLDYPVGEGGKNLSGGQRQRVALGRALLLQNDILLLDEPTSNLDGFSDAAFKRALYQFRRGRTNVVISHRLSTIQSADQIIVIDKGRVESVGTHEDLLRESITYRALVESQRIE